MKRENFDIAAGIVERMDKLKKTIFDLQGITNKKSFIIVASDNDSVNKIKYPPKLPFKIPEFDLSFDEKDDNILVNLNSDEIATIVFTQDILEYYINTLNLELEELRKSFEDLA